MAACLSILLASISLPTLAQDLTSKAHVDEVLKGLSRGRGFGAVAISPDGRLLAYVRRAKDGAELVVAPRADPSKTTKVSAAKK